jgi:hypothetical protein
MRSNHRTPKDGSANTLSLHESSQRLIKQLAELEDLRDQVRKAELRYQVRRQASRTGSHKRDRQGP